MPLGDSLNVFQSSRLSVSFGVELYMFSLILFNFFNFSVFSFFKKIKNLKINRIVGILG